MHDRLRRQQQHTDRGGCECAEGDSGAVDHDADEHDRDHDVGALRRHFRTRQQQIERGGKQRGTGRPFQFSGDVTR